ncbi:MAG: Gfo/Idh/MocA family oxidoreductase, partial [Planctomycetota bacterium]|nr:Gfo/Idh/MocA family oxidoreductase [Planctomycetota bacterium]
VLKVGVIGLGHLHPRTYMPHFEAAADTQVVAASDADKSLRDSFAADFQVRAHGDWDELLREEDIDLAYIFLPHDECPAAAEACAARGIHVVVEKPVANTAGGCRRVVEACDRSGVYFSTPYMWRLHPVCREMKRIVDSGVLGRIVGCEGRCAAGGLHRYIEGNAAWMLQRQKSGGGPMYNLGVHWIDLFRWFLDDEIVEVLGKNVHVNLDYDIEDNSFAICTFAGGSTLALDISYTVPDSYPNGRDLYLSLRGTKGCLNYSPAFEGSMQTLHVCSDDHSFGDEPSQMIDFLLEPLPGYCGSLGLEYVETVAHDIRDNRPPLIGGRDAIKALQVVEAIYDSSQTGKTVGLEGM